MSESIPKDPMMLMSFINMKLRDEYPNLEELCKSLQIDPGWLIDQLRKIGMEYSQEENKFW